MATPPTRTTATVTSKDGTKLEYDRIGSGPPLVIVNGALSVRTFTFAQKMADHLATRFEVHNYDRRGRGGSAVHTSSSLVKEVEDVAAVCAAAGGRPYVVGFSSGAALALEAAAAGVPMAGLYAYEPPYVAADPDNRADTDHYATNIQAYVDRNDRDGAVSFFMRFVGVPGFGVFVMRRLPMWKVMRGVAHTLPYDAAVMGAFKVPAGRLAKVRAAVKGPLVVASGEKTAPALKVGAQAAAAAAKAEHRTVPKANHGVKPGQLLPELLQVFDAGGAGNP